MRHGVVSTLDPVFFSGTAPYFIVVAERKGFPPVEQQVLAHCLENIWLKATALGLGFQLVSITAQMADNPAFCTLLGISPGEWALIGCAVGYPVKELSPLSALRSMRSHAGWNEKINKLHICRMSFCFPVLPPLPIQQIEKLTFI